MPFLNKSWFKKFQISRMLLKNLYISEISVASTYIVAGLAITTVIFGALLLRNYWIYSCPDGSSVAYGTWTLSFIKEKQRSLEMTPLAQKRPRKPNIFVFLADDLGKLY